MPGYLRRGTATTITMGPLVGPVDGITPYTGGGFTVKLAKAGGALAARGDATAIVHDADGYYTVTLNPTDTGTTGPLRVTIPGSVGNYLPAWDDFSVLPAPIYDALFGTVPTPAGLANDLPSMLVQIWRTFFRPIAKDATAHTIKTFADDGTTVVTTQPFSDDGAGNESRGPAT
jgi:hypothetical protein